MAIKIMVSPATIAALDRRKTAVRNAIKEGEDRRRVLEDIKWRQNARWEENMQEEGGEYRKWPKLAEYTLGDRVARGFGRSPILQRTANLNNVVGAQMYGARLNNASITWKLADEGGAWPATHWAGYTNPRTGGRVPSRKVWQFDKRDENENAVLIEAFFANLLEGI